MENTSMMNTIKGHQSLFGNLSVPQANSESTYETAQSPSDPVESPMSEKEGTKNNASRSTTSAFTLFAPSIQMAWLDDLKMLSRYPRYASLPPEASSFDLYRLWRKLYNLSHDAEGRPWQRPTDDELRRDIIPFDLLKVIITKLMNDASLAMDKARQNALNDTSIPEDIKEGAPTIYDLPPQRQKVVKESLLNSVPYPGLVPPENWVRWLNQEDKEQAPTIDTSGLDTFLRIARALAALGMPTYVCNPDGGKYPKFYSSAIEAAIWTDLGRQRMHDWTIKQSILRVNYGLLRTYLASPAHHLTSFYWDIAFSEELWSPIDFQLASQKIIQTTDEGIWMPNTRPGDQQKEPTASAQLVSLEHHWLQLDCWTNPVLRSSPGTFREMFRSLFSIDNGAQNLCSFPNFIRVRCGGGKDRTRQQAQSAFVINAVSHDGNHGYRNLSCLYKLKIVWRVSSALGDNGLKSEPRKDDFKLYDSERYQALLRRAQDPEQLPQKDEGDNWILETSPIDYCFVLVYYRIGNEMNEEGFQKDWESDPEVKRIYPEHSTFIQGDGTDGQVLSGRCK